MNNTIKLRAEDKGTAKNMNGLGMEEREMKVKHIKARYGNKLIDTAHDRLELWAAGADCDYQLTSMLRQAGITM